jgi:4-hydroxy-2-oxoheptanedioate aldolase
MTEPTPRASVVKARLAAGEPVVLATAVLAQPVVVEMMGLLGFHCVFLDMEHWNPTLETVYGLVLASRAHGMDAMVRIAKGEFMRMQRALELGASGVMYPRIDDEAEAEQVVSWAKFPPRGRRGADGANVDGRFGMGPPLDRYVKEANDRTFVCVQVESLAAARRADAIAAVEGVDVLFMGPGDLSLSLGVPCDWRHPDLIGVAETMAAAAGKHGKNWGMPVFDAEHGRWLLDHGARFLVRGADIFMVQEGLRTVRRELEELGVTFLRGGDNG